MSDFERGKFYPKKKFSNRVTLKRHEKDQNAGESSKIKQPTILLKAREPTEEGAAASPKKVQQKEPEPQVSIQPSIKESESFAPPTTKQMSHSIKLIQSRLINTQVEGYLQENSDFLVVGVMGSQSVGKSTILNLIAQDNDIAALRKTIFKSHYKKDSDAKESSEEDEEQEDMPGEVFRIESVDDLENCSHATNGIDIFVTNNRIILLDCQPHNSLSLLNEFVTYEKKRTCCNNFVGNCMEIHALELTTFLMSVCHVLILVQDYFFDPDIPKFVLSAEMLKPILSNNEEEPHDYSPHLLLVHNKAKVEDFQPEKFRKMQEIYRFVFQKSKLITESNLGMGSGRIVNSLNPEQCGNPINLFLIPEFDPENDEGQIFVGSPPFLKLVKRLRANVMGATKHPLTHIQLTEKTWLTYCVKAWTHVLTSKFFTEYSKLMP